SGPPPVRRRVRVLRALRLLAHRQPGAGGLPDGAAAASPLAALVERGGGRHPRPAGGAGDLALQPLPAVLGGSHRPARRLLLRVRDRALRVGDASCAGGTAVARTPLSATSQRLRIALALPALLGIFGLGEAILDRRALRLDLTPG